MIKRSVIAALLLLAAVQPAQALEYGGWYGRATLDGWHDDNLARQDQPLPEFYPRGNQDVGGELGLALGSVLLLNPDMDLWVTATGRASRAVLYPEWSGNSAGLFADLDWHWADDMGAYFSTGSSLYFGGSPFYLGEVGVERRLWPGAWLNAATNFGYSSSDTPEFRYSAPGASLGLQQSFPTGTRLAVSYGYLERLFGTRSDTNHQLYLLAAQRMDNHWELRARYSYNFVFSPQRSYRNGFFTMGMAFSL